MANYDYVFAYDTRYEQWLTQQGYSHPAVQPANRLLATGDLKWALATYPSLTFDGRFTFGRYIHEQGNDAYVLCIEGFDWNDDMAQPGECFKVRGDPLWEFTLLVKLCQRCGQLLLYPDTGSPAVILNATNDPEQIHTLWREAYTRDDGWLYLHQKLYS